jgi:hypothetical protein
MSAELVSAPEPVSTWDGQAAQVLDAAVVPVGAQQVSSLTGSVFSQPASAPACNPLFDHAGYWVVPGRPQAIASFLESHAPAWIPNLGYGSGGVKGSIDFYTVLDSVVGPGWNSADELTFVVAAHGTGSTGIRADAEVVPSGAECISAEVARARSTPR